MVVVLSAVAVCLLVASPFGVALFRYLAGRMPAPPEPHVCPRSDRHPAVVLAELEVRHRYEELFALYDTPGDTGTAHQ